MGNSNNEQIKKQKQNDENIPQDVKEIESFNDSDELDSENLETIQGGKALEDCIVDSCGIDFSR